jgi:hypothetical protein
MSSIQIPDPDPDFLPIPDPDPGSQISNPGVKETQYTIALIPDPGSEFATLEISGLLRL